MRIGVSGRKEVRAMLKESCPGSREIRSPFPEEIECVFCGAKTEIWSDESETKCKACNRIVGRDLKATCLLWCPAAKECVGTEKYERLVKAMKG
jgi:hypothetical protein